MHNPAPRSHSEATMRSEVSREACASPLESWTQQFVPSQSVGARWRWWLLSGVFIAGALFPVGKNSNAANENQTESVSEKLRPPIQENGQPLANSEAPLPAGKPESLPTTDSQPSPVSSATTAAPVPEAPASAPPSDSSAGPTVKLTLVVDGQLRRISAPAGINVYQALFKAGVELHKHDRIWPDAKTPVRDDLKVRVETVRVKLETRSEALEPAFRVQLSTQIAPGREQLVQYGKSGTSEVTEKVTFVGGKRIRKAFVSRKTSVPAQDKVLALGVDDRFLPGVVRYHKRYARAFQLQRQMSARGGSPRDRMEQSEGATLRPVKSLTVRTSGYAAGPAGGSLGNYTATGMRCVRGAVATDPRVIPLGTKLYIEGYGYAFACDTGGAIKGNRIDLAFNTVRECFQHGRRSAKVWILAD